MVVFNIVSGNRNRVKGFSRKKAPRINGRTEQIRKRSNWSISPRVIAGINGIVIINKRDTIRSVDFLISLVWQIDLE